MRLDAPLLAHLAVGERIALDGMAAESGDPAVLLVEGAYVSAVAPGTATLRLARGAGERAFAVTVWPRPEGIAVRPDRPRLRFTAGELAARRARAEDDPEVAAMLRAVLAVADGFVAEPAIAYEWAFGGRVWRTALAYPLRQPEEREQPDGFTDYPFWTRLSREIERRLGTLAFAWSMTGDSRYAARAAGMLRDLAGWAKWHEYDTATNNLSLPHLTIGVAIAYDELHAVLSPEERALIAEAILRLGLRPMAHWFGSDLDHNIAALMHVGMVTGALAIADDRPEALLYLDRARHYLRWYLRQREESRVSEGIVYTAYAMATLLDATDRLTRAAGIDDLAASAYVRDEMMAFFAYQYVEPGLYATLSDATRDDHPYALMARSIEGWNDPFAAWLLQFRHPLPPTPQAISLAGARSPATLDAPPLRHFARIGWVAARSGWTGPDDLVVATCMAEGVGHNHFDQGNVVLAVRGHWLLVDPGYQDYSPGPGATFTTQSIGHNVLLVNGNGQSLRGGGTIVSARSAGDRHIIALDPAGAYEGALRGWRRTLVFRPGHWLAIVDRVAPASASDRIVLLFHGPVREPEGASFAIGEGEISARGEVVASCGLTLTRRVAPGAEGYGPWIEVSTASGAERTIATLVRWDGAAWGLALAGRTVLVDGAAVDGEE